MSSKVWFLKCEITWFQCAQVPGWLCCNGKNVVFFSKNWGFFLKISFFHSNLLGSRRIWMKNSHFDEYILNYWWKWEHFLISSVYEEVFFTAFSISYLAVHFLSLNKNRGVYQNSVKSILYKSVVQIEWCRSKLHRISSLPVILAGTRLDVNMCVSL